MPPEARCVSKAPPRSGGSRAGALADASKEHLHFTSGWPFIIWNSSTTVRSSNPLLACALGLAPSPDVVKQIHLHLPPSLELLRFEGFDMSEDWEEGFEYCRAALETALGSLKNRRGLVVEVLFHAGQATAARKRLGDLVGDFEAKEITLKMQELEVSRPGPPMPTE